MMVGDIEHPRVCTSLASHVRNAVLAYFAGCRFYYAHTRNLSASNASRSTERHTDLAPSTPPNATPRHARHSTNIRSLIVFHQRTCAMSASVHA